MQHVACAEICVIAGRRCSCIFHSEISRSMSVALLFIWY